MPPPKGHVFASAERLCFVFVGTMRLYCVYIRRQLRRKAYWKQWSHTYIYAVHIYIYFNRSAPLLEHSVLGPSADAKLLSLFPRGTSINWALLQCGECNVGGTLTLHSFSFDTMYSVWVCVNICLVWHPFRCTQIDRSIIDEIRTASTEMQPFSVETFAVCIMESVETYIVLRVNDDVSKVAKERRPTRVID